MTEWLLSSGLYNSSVLSHVTDWLSSGLYNSSVLSHVTDWLLSSCEAV